MLDHLRIFAFAIDHYYEIEPLLIGRGEVAHLRWGLWKEIGVTSLGRPEIIHTSFKI